MNSDLIMTIMSAACSGGTIPAAYQLLLSDQNTSDVAYTGTLPELVFDSCHH